MDFKQYALSKQTSICLELDRVRLLLKKAGNPDKQLRIIHVAGTNGKGSVCSFVCCGLGNMGKRTGRFSSPELFCVNDTITVNGTEITASELDSLLEELAPLSHEVEAELGRAPSQFEITFVAALMHFVNTKCEYAVLECGMGGIGDATNAVCDSEISVITKIALDHKDYLGDTVEEIAANKCGIFKDSSVVVTGFQSGSVMNVIRNMADGRRLVIASEVRSCGHRDFKEVFDCKSYTGLTSSLCGLHQIYNASVAIEVLELLGASSQNIRYAVENASNPARLERLGDNIFFDGAHNPDGVKALVNSLNRYVEGGKVIFVVGFMKDKDYISALSLLGELKIRDFELYTVNVKTNPRSETSHRLCKAAMDLGFSATAYDSVSDAIYDAATIADLVVAFGSLYMYKEYVKR